ncbi:MAG: hypothetical protein OXU61_10335 [Gammaproteobacteria bacterium]|nr:hypothetical protein [Gammaproteobacteria bacterium]
MPSSFGCPRATGGAGFPRASLVEDPGAVHAVASGRWAQSR